MDCRIRLATPADAAAIQSIYAPYVETTPITFTVDPPTVAELQEEIAVLEQYPWLVCEAKHGTDDEVIGYAAASALRKKAAYRWTVELSVYVAEPAQGAGIGTALYHSLLSVLEAQGFYHAYGVVTLPNPASVRLHERMGFESIGTFPNVGYKQGKWHDVQWWHRRLADLPDEPDPPQSISAIEDTPAFEAALNAGESQLKE